VSSGSGRFFHKPHESVDGWEKSKEFCHVEKYAQALRSVPIAMDVKTAWYFREKERFEKFILEQFWNNYA
jgi:hypothetical protein